MEPTPFVYPCRVTKTTDADTHSIDVDLGWWLWLRDKPCRIVGIDTPEKHPGAAGRTPESLARERQAAQAATQFARDAIAAADLVVVESRTLDKYGRLLGELHLHTAAGWKPLGALLIEAGHAYPYDGGTKRAFDDWHAAH